MAEKHVILFSSIHVYFKNDSAQLRRGEIAYRDNHVTNMLYDPTIKPPLLKGDVLASMKKKKYKVEMVLDDQKLIHRMTCTCPAGQEICHHMAAFALYCHYNLVSTSVACTWNVPARPPDEGIKKIKDIFPSKPFRATSNGCDEEAIGNFRSALSRGKAVGYSWLLHPNVAPDFVQLVPEIENIIFSHEYNEKEDKTAFFMEQCRVTDEQIVKIAKDRV